MVSDEIVESMETSLDFKGVDELVAKRRTLHKVGNKIRNKTCSNTNVAISLGFQRRI